MTFEKRKIPNTVHVPAVLVNKPCDSVRGAHRKIDSKKLVISSPKLASNGPGRCFNETSIC